MRCPQCSHENLPGSRFCSECAGRLPAVCPDCGAVNEAAAKFCNQCASPLTGEVAAAPAAVSPTPLAKSREPVSFAGGRYEVNKFLGEGGKKRVYLAHDTLLDRDVAFALIKTEGLDDTSRTRIHREAQAMGRLGSHPYIVTVFDLGEHQGQPFMVTEFMGGGDVEHLIEKAEGNRVPLE